MSYDDFIMGKRPISEWSQVQDEIRESAERICENLQYGSRALMHNS